MRLLRVVACLLALARPRRDPPSRPQPRRAPRIHLAPF